ncbi:MAG: diphthine--ammonia ligase [Candidatus Micrarchaeota archaeon]|nr:diphthine--ammonia ligase [Candidatus Micrarchaeota archaeon]
MKVAVLFSGGKDSVFAAFACASQGWEVSLLTIMPAEYSTMFHHPNIQWCAAQAEAMGMPLKTVEADGERDLAELSEARDGRATALTEEDELSAIKEALREMRVDGVATGAIESEYQKQRIDRIAHELSIRSFSPIWRTGGVLLSEQCAFLETYVVAVSAEGLGKDDLGARFDEKFVSRLKKMKPSVSLHLEGGEGETFVAGAPFFSKALKIGEMEKEWDGSRGVARITALRA